MMLLLCNSTLQPMCKQSVSRTPPSQSTAVHLLSGSAEGKVHRLTDAPGAERFVKGAAFLTLLNKLFVSPIYIWERRAAVKN